MQYEHDGLQNMNTTSKVFSLSILSQKMCNYLSQNYKQHEERFILNASIHGLLANICHMFFNLMI